MTKQGRITTLCSMVFLVASLFFLTYERIHKPRVFILHSYHPTMPWVASLNEGVQKVFGDRQYINLRYFYMNTKTRTNPGYLKRIQKSALNSIKQFDPDIIIAFDPASQDLIRNHYKNHQKIKIILAGLTDSNRWQEYDKSNTITGITEQIPINALREILSIVFRHKRRVYILSDDSIAAHELEKTMKNQNWGSFELTGHKKVKTFHEWQQAVHEAEEIADILIVSQYHTLKEGNKLVEPKRVVKWMNDHCKIPAVGIYESFIINGGLISIAISSMEQGFTAAWLALNVLEKRFKVEHIPLLHGKSFSLFMNRELLLKKFPEAHIPTILEAFSRSNLRIDHESVHQLHLANVIHKHQLS